MTVPIVLAAGASRRMGQPKALLRIGGLTALERILDTCRAAGCAAPVVVIGAFAPETLATIPLAGACVVHHPGWASGRTGSLQAGMASAPRESDLLVFPVDHPLVLEATVTALREASSSCPPTGIVVPVHAGRRGHPILLRAGLREELQRLGPDEPLHELVRRDPGRVLPVTVADEGVLLDLDTPGDARAAEELWAARRRTGALS